LLYNIGLNRDIWHTVTVRIDVHGARLIAKVDNISAERIIQGLHKSSNYGISTDLTSVVLIGGMKIFVMKLFKTIRLNKTIYLIS
jgi:hypothetical protein